MMATMTPFPHAMPALLDPTVADANLAPPSIEPSTRAGLAEAARYLVASIAALALDASLLLVLAQGGLAPWLAGAIAYLAGLVLIYRLSTRWVFTHREVADHRREFVVFAALGAFGLLFNSVTLHVATSLGATLPIAKGCAAAIGFTTNFASRKLVLFTAHRRARAVSRDAF